MGLNNARVVWHVPIEPLEERYSAQWLRWYPKAFANAKIRHNIVPGAKVSDKVKTGSWLDCHFTMIYKSAQLQFIYRAIETGAIKDGDVLFFYDLWFPGIEGIRYVCDIAGINIRIVGYLHAGTWDNQDLLSRKLNGWAKPFEKTLLTVVDKVFTASGWHENLILQAFPEMVGLEDKLVRIPLGFDFLEYESYIKLSSQKQDLVVFPHRMDPEKQPEKFNELVKINPDRFKFTKEACGCKHEYFEMLSVASGAVSFALQETFGIAMVEAAYLGCRLYAPSRLSYPEVLDGVIDRYFIYDQRITSSLKKWNFEQDKLSDLAQVRIRDFLKRKYGIDHVVGLIKRVLEELK